MRRRRNKFGAIKTKVDGILFSSKGEAGRYSELKVLEKVGVITNLKLQQKFALNFYGFKICTYIADFTYNEPSNSMLIVEDFKGVQTAVFKLKWKMMKAIFPGNDYRITYGRSKTKRTR